MSRIEEGMVIKHFKRELLEDKSSLKYLYIFVGEAKHTETGEKLAIYQSLENEEMFARPYDMFMGKVDKEKYPNIKQEYRLEEALEEEWFDTYYEVARRNEQEAQQSKM